MTTHRFFAPGGMKDQMFRFPRKGELILPEPIIKPDTKVVSSDSLFRPKGDSSFATPSGKTADQLAVTGSKLDSVKFMTRESQHYVVFGFKDGSRLFVVGGSYGYLPFAVHEQMYTTSFMQGVGEVHSKSDPPRFVFALRRKFAGAVYENELDGPIVDLLYAPQSALVCRSRSATLVSVDPSLYSEDWVTLLLSNMRALTVRLEKSNLVGLISVVGEEARLLHNGYRSEHNAAALEKRFAELMGGRS